MSTFSVVATPIGNLEDITLRALRVLKTCDLILCEDTRMTKRLLHRHEINTPTRSYHTHSKLSQIEDIILQIKEGKNIALVSDAGTPGISDPGIELVTKIRRECADEIASGSLKIEAIPGPSALTAAISVAGIPASNFTFLGFLPHKKGRETLFKEIAISERTIIFYESPHRIMKTLESLVQHLSNPEADGEIIPKKIAVVREITKVFEEVFVGSASEVLNHFTVNKDRVRGEFVVIVSSL